MAARNALALARIARAPGSAPVSAAAACATSRLWTGRGGAGSVGGGAGARGRGGSYEQGSGFGSESGSGFGSGFGSGIRGFGTRANLPVNDTEEWASEQIELTPKVRRPPSKNTAGQPNSGHLVIGLWEELRSAWQCDDPIKRTQAALDRMTEYELKDIGAICVSLAADFPGCPSFSMGNDTRGKIMGVIVNHPKITDQIALLVANLISDTYYMQDRKEWKIECIREDIDLGPFIKQNIGLIIAYAVTHAECSVYATRIIIEILDGMLAPSPPQLGIVTQCNDLENCRRKAYEDTNGVYIFCEHCDFQLSADQKAHIRRAYIEALKNDRGYTMDLFKDSEVCNKFGILEDS